MWWLLYSRMVVVQHQLAALDQLCLSVCVGSCAVGSDAACKRQVELLEGCWLRFWMQ